MFKLIFKNNYDVVQTNTGVIIHKGSYDYDLFEKWMEEGNIPAQPKTIPADEQLRWKRNALLSQCDIPWGLADFQHLDKQAWLDYRQALRDLPDNSDPQLDENDNLTNVVFPVPPSAQ